MIILNVIPTVYTHDANHTNICMHEIDVISFHIDDLSVAKSKSLNRKSPGDFGEALEMNFPTWWIVDGDPTNWGPQHDLLLGIRKIPYPIYDASVNYDSMIKVFDLYGIRKKGYEHKF